MESGGIMNTRRWNGKFKLRKKFNEGVSMAVLAKSIILCSIPEGVKFCRDNCVFQELENEYTVLDKREAFWNKPM